MGLVRFKPKNLKAGASWQGLENLIGRINHPSFVEMKPETQIVFVKEALNCLHGFLLAHLLTMETIESIKNGGKKRGAKSKKKLAF